MNQRAGKTHAASLHDGDKISLGSLIKFLEAAKKDLDEDPENQEASYRFEIMIEWFRNDFKGPPLKYTPRAIGI